LFFIQVLYHVWRIWKKSLGVDKWFALATLVYLSATTLLNVAGQIFIRGYNTNNLNTFIMSVILLSLMPSLSNNQDSNIHISKSIS
jgi:hypothetical protein